MDDNSYEETYEVSNTGGILAVMMLIIGLLLGALAGAGAMLLLAPQSGKRTRKQIRRKGRTLRKQATRSIEGGANQVRAKVHPGHSGGSCGRLSSSSLSP
jgi:gas vesicle protein